MLDSVGVDEFEERVYRLLLAESAADPAGLAARLGVPYEQVSGAVHRLAALGLATFTGDPTEVSGAVVDVVRPIHPVRALTPLLARRRRELRADEQRLDLAEDTVSELATVASQASDGTSAEVRVHRDTAAAFTCLEHIAATATRQVLVLAASGPAPGVTDATDYSPIVGLAVQLAERGVPLRVIMLDSISYLAPLIEGANRMRRAGVEIRTSPVLPAWTFVVDDEYVVTAFDPDHHDRGSVLVRTPGAVAAGADLFRQYWQQASPLGGTDAPTPHGLTEGQRRLLIMIANGRKDETIARRFSVSARTVRRMVAELYDLAGVSSRIQLVFRAAQFGWLDGSELDRI